MSLTSSLTSNISSYTDFVRLNINKKTEKNKLELEQYFSSAALSKLMASMMSYKHKEIDILDPGSGIGSLFVACIDEIITRDLKPKRVTITAYEIDSSLSSYLNECLRQCKKLCEKNNIQFYGKLIQKDFVDESVRILQNDGQNKFSHIIINPPYKKINTSSETYQTLKEVGLETVNMYTAFVALSEKMLTNNGEMVFITPRSFCNGPYFHSFRKNFLQTMTLKRIHIFNSRSASFRDDDVLQENVIIHAIKNSADKASKNIVISSNSSPDDEHMIRRKVKSENVIFPNDSQYFIHIVTDEIGTQVSYKMRHLDSALETLEINVSTGKVVDFRIKDALKFRQGKNTVPLIHPFNLSNGMIQFPVQNKKPNFIEVNAKSKNLLVENGNYVLVKRFTAKEEKRRITASVWSKKQINASHMGFENRINYFHRNGSGLELDIAKGLSLFLNSTIVDLYFRQFNGHTQVNSTDLRYLQYPTYDQLKLLGRKIFKKYPDQKEIDNIIEEVLFDMTEKSSKLSPIPAKQKIDEAISILKQLGLPKEQQNERSALTLLALLDLKPKDSWKKSGCPLCGITPMMNFFDKNYGKKYAPNTRETVRRQTVHQFLQAGLIVENPDKPERPTNSPKAVYQIEKNALSLLQSFSTANWEKNLKQYKKSIQPLKQQYDNARKMKLIPLKITGNKTINLSAGGQNPLVKKILTEFAPRFTPNGIPFYVGDTGKKFAYFDEDGFKKLGISNIDPHGKIPDVIIHHTKKNWLLLIEAVTSHGPINPKRRNELKKIFSKSKIGLVYVTAFLDKKTMTKYVRDISWETEVWISDSPTHLIHFNGERFLGPYD